MAKKSTRKSKKGTAKHKKAVRDLRTMKQAHKKLSLKIKKHEKRMQAELIPFVL